MDLFRKLDKEGKMAKTMTSFECKKHNYSFERWSEMHHLMIDPVLCPRCVSEKLIELGVNPLVPTVAKRMGNAH